MRSFIRTKDLIISLVIVLFIQTALAQAVTPTTCSLKNDESPTLLGLKLGMTKSEVSAVLGRNVALHDISSKIRVISAAKDSSVVQKELPTKGPIGEKEYYYYPSDESNIGSIYLRFWDEKLYTIALDYEPRDFTWSTQKSDSHVIAEKLGFPLTPWEGTRLTCSEFYVDASHMSDGVRIEITDSVIKDKIKTIAEKTISDEAKQLGPAPNFKRSSEQPPTLKNKIDPPVLKTKKHGL